MASPEDIYRAALGKEAWNDWAEKSPKAKVDFSQASLYTADFRGFIFPGDVNFQHARFAGNADFGHCRFLGETAFSYARFRRKADFSYATFAGKVDLDRVDFGDDASFEASTFRGYAYIVHSDFKYASFKLAKFDRLELTHSTFTGEVVFTQAMFNSASFNGARFEHPLTSFEAATFRQVPDFRGSSFRPAAIFHKAHVVGDWTGRWWNLRRAVRSDDAEKYRRLKVLAAAGKDFARELAYFADELRAKRGHETTKPAAVFLNLAYEVVSDFGRSAARPFLILVALTLAVWILKMATHWSKACTDEALLVLSITDGALLLGFDKSAIRDDLLPVSHTSVD